MATPNAILTPNSPVLASAPTKELNDDAPDAIELGAPVQRRENTSIFSRWQKRWISLITSFAAMFSTLSSFVYLPALTPISRDLSVSITLMNLTVTSYLVVAGIAPAFIGDIADQSGRKPVYILMFLLMLAANLGMANLTRWSVLLVLRMILSTGASGTVSVAYGVVADITTAGERGSFIGTIFLFTTMAPSLGPVLGGILAEKLGWRWIFWFLSILTGGTLVILALLLPETQRKIVGDGSLPARGIYWSLVSPKASRSTRQSQGDAEPREKRGCRFPNPLTCLPVLMDKGSLFSILIGALQYVNIMTLQTSLASLSIEIYDLNYLQAGLIYIPCGVCSAVSAKVTGKYIDWNFRRTRHRLGVEDARSVGDIEGFPLEHTRLEGAYLLTIICALTTVGYGLVVEFKTMTATLITDYNTHRSATAQAASNLIRCVGAGAGTASFEPLIRAIGSGWAFAIYAILVLLQVPLIWGLKRNGMAWRSRNK
ncbi:Quinidine resistance protein 1 [Fusarium falciforme]|uniref:Quinidine resistance protein 1 n=1 Tax=Fusarium falciforme TaxID=195108 RepID=UPI002301BC23|nr:Quinidine resistance protein 1 [Fusarium falciforme]WAO84730.1 Quinidine resistance protein 1 [Fusarium falciforme]